MPLALFLNVWLISYPPSPREWVSHSQTTMGVPQPFPIFSVSSLILGLGICALRLTHSPLAFGVRFSPVRHVGGACSFGVGFRPFPLMADS